MKESSVIKATPFGKASACVLLAIVTVLVLSLCACSAASRGIEGTWRQGTARLTVSDNETKWKSNGTVGGNCSGTVSETSKGVYRFEITSTGAAMTLELSADGRELIAYQSWENGFLGGTWERA